LPPSFRTFTSPPNGPTDEARRCQREVRRNAKEILDLASALKDPLPTVIDALQLGMQAAVCAALRVHDSMTDDRAERLIHVTLWQR
jgi:hypothetical protein